MKKVLISLICVSFLFGLVVMSFAASPEPRKEIHIGCAVAMTGRVAPEGKELLKGLELWQKVVNGLGGIDVKGTKYEVKITFYDDKSDSATGTKLTEKLITEDKVQFLFGPFSSGITLATSAIGEKYRMITIAPQANAPLIYERGFKYVFSILPPLTKHSQPIFDLAAAQKPKPKTAAFVIANDLSPITLAQGARERAEQLGIQVVLFEKYPADATDLTILLRMAKEKNADIFFSAGYIKDAMIIIRQAHEVGLYAKIMGFTGGVIVPEFLQSLGEEGNYVVECEWWLPTLKDKDKVFGTTENFVKLFKDMHGYVPNYYASVGPAAGLVLQTAIEKAGSIETEAVRQALTSTDLRLSCFPGIKFNEKGQNISSDHPIVQVQNGKYVVVWPPENPLVYPVPKWEGRKQK